MHCNLNYSQIWAEAHLIEQGANHSFKCLSEKDFHSPFTVIAITFHREK